jgi:hypothetical protein
LTTIGGGLKNVLIDVPLNVEFPHDVEGSALVIADKSQVLMDLSRWIGLLRWIDRTISHLDELVREYQRIVSINGADTRVP